MARFRLPQLNALRAFEVASRTLNFRTASIELGVTHGAVAQQVRALERHLDVQLFNRQPRGVSLTEEGQALAGDVSQAFELLAAATSRLAAPRGVVVISVPPTFAAKVLVPQLTRIQQDLPGVELRTLATPDVSDFARDGVDIAVRMADAVPSNLESHLLFRQRIMAVASPELVRGRALPLSDEDLRTLPVIHDAHDHWQHFMPGQPMQGISFNQTLLALDAAIAGRGVALACDAYTGMDVAAGKLVVVSDRVMDTRPGFFLVRRPSSSTAGAAARFWRWALTSWTRADA